MDTVFVSESLRFRQFWVDKIVKLSLDEKIQAAYEFLHHKKALPALQKQSSKSAAKATEYKNLGNVQFRLGNNLDAAYMYTKSVAVAPVPSTELAIAYANRSAPMARIDRDRECLLDINRAFQENYPEAGKQKLIDRKKNCVRRFRSVMNVAKNLHPGVHHAFDICYDVSVDKLIKEFDPDRAEPLETHALRFRAPKMDFQNEIIPNASEKIKIKCDDEFKTSVIASDRIKPGDILAIEKSYASYLSEEYRYSNCANCFLRCDALIHCPTCSMVMFCSEICRNEAFEKFHRIECQIFSMFPVGKEDQISFSKWTAFRTLLVATKQGRELDQMMNHPVYKLPLGTKFGRNLPEKFDSEDYSSVFYYGKRTKANNFEDYASKFPIDVFLNVAEWLYLLRRTSFFGELEEGKENFDAPLTDRELFAGAFLLRSLQNDVRMIEEGIDRQKIFCIRTRKFSPIGPGLFPLLNLFGHSCDPHVIMSSYENVLVCRAVRPIKAGEQIFDCYGGVYHQNPKHKRALYLREHFNSECNCKPCELDWPIYNKLPKTYPEMRSCKVSVRKFVKYAARFRKMKEDPDYEVLGDPATVKFLCKFSSLLGKRFGRPCRDAIDCENLLKMSYASIANYYSVDEFEDN